MTSRRQVLEDVLRADFSRENLAIYADALQEEGDPRGELIAIDLRIAEHGLVDALTTRRTELLHELLGREAAEHFRYYRKGAFQFAFGDVHINATGGAWLDAERAMFDSPLGAYLRRVTIGGGEKQIRSGVATLVQRTHTWLRALHVHYNTMASQSTQTIVSARKTRELIEATPVLESMKVTRSTTTANAALRPVVRSSQCA